MAVADKETLDSAYESTVEDNSNVAHGREKTKGKLNQRKFIENNKNNVKKMKLST